MEALLTWPGVIIIGLICITVIVALILGRSIAISKSGVTVTGPDGKKKSSSPHATCAFKGSAVNAVRRTAEFVERKNSYRDDTLIQQMAVYDETREEIIAMFKSIFASIILEKRGVDASFTSNEEYTQFENMLVALFAELTIVVRRWFKHNHYALRNAQEQVEYIRRKKEVVCQLIEESLDRRWAGVVVTRGDIKEALAKREDDWLEYVEDVLNKAFAISRLQANLRAALEESYYKYIKETFGDDIQITGDLDGATTNFFI